MYTVSKGPSKIVAKTRRGLAQNFEKFESIKESSKKSVDLNTPEVNNIPRPVFQTKRVTPVKVVEEDVITPQHEEIIRYVSDSWNILVAQNPYDTTGCKNKATSSQQPTADANNNSVASAFVSQATAASATAATTTTGAGGAATGVNSVPFGGIPAARYCIEPPSPVLSDFKPFDLESWWGRRLFQNITKSL